MLDWFDITMRLTVAAAMGGAIGLNRHLHHKATGLRTLSLIACSAAGLVLAALYGADGALHFDAMSRVVQGIMTGLGFIGVGVIMHEGADKVHGLTTAAAVWTTAALGVLCGTGAWKVVVVLAVVVWVVLLLGGPLERRCEALARKPGEPGA